MVITQNVSFDAELELFQHFVTAVCDVHIDKKTISADPNLTMKSCCNADDLRICGSCIHVLIGCSQWTR